MVESVGVDVRKESNMPASPQQQKKLEIFYSVPRSKKKKCKTSLFMVVLVTIYIASSALPFVMGIHRQTAGIGDHRREDCKTCRAEAVCSVRVPCMPFGS